jgi:hypothetical protein
MCRAISTQRQPDIHLEQDESENEAAEDKIMNDYEASDVPLNASSRLEFHVKHQHLKTVDQKCTNS